MEHNEQPAIPAEHKLHTVVSLYSLVPQVETHDFKSTEIYFEEQLYTQLVPSIKALESSISFN